MTAKQQYLERYEKWLVLSNYSSVYSDEPTLADAILDRIIPKAHRIELMGKSLRKRAKHLS